MNAKTITVGKGDATLVLFGEISRKKEKSVRKILYTTLERLEDIMTVPAGVVIAEFKKTNPLIGTAAGSLKAYRLREGLTQTELAKKAGLKQHHISEMESGKRGMGAKNAKRLAKILNCRVEKLLK